MPCHAVVQVWINGTVSKFFTVLFSEEKKKDGKTIPDDDDDENLLQYVWGRGSLKKKHGIYFLPYSHRTRVPHGTVTCLPAGRKGKKKRPCFVLFFRCMPARGPSVR